MKKLKDLGKPLTKEQQRQISGGATWKRFYACSYLDPCDTWTACHPTCGLAGQEATANCPYGADIGLCQCVAC